MNEDATGLYDHSSFIGCILIMSSKLHIQAVWTFSSNKKTVGLTVNRKIHSNKCFDTDPIYSDNQSASPTVGARYRKNPFKDISIMTNIIFIIGCFQTIP